MKGYDTAEYAASRLVETIIRYNDEPVIVRAVIKKDGDIVVRYTSLLDDSDKIIDVPLSKCDINPVPLGYVNFKYDSYYLMRTPMRRDWRQGLRMLNIVDVRGQNPRLIPYRTIAQTIMGKFPSFKGCLERLSKEELSKIAFSRDFSIARNGNLEYKDWVIVGEVNMNNGNVSIKDNCNWVREALDEQMEAA